MKKLLTISIVLAIMAVCNQAMALDFTEVDLGSSSQVDITDEFADYCVTFENVYRYIDIRDPWSEVDDYGYGISNGIEANNNIPAEMGVVNFTVPVPAVEIDWWTITGTMYVDAYDSSDVLVDSYSGSGSGTEMLSGASDISYITFHNGGGFVQIANMRFPYLCPLEVEIDIKPGSCPNPLNPKSKGVVPVAVVGTLDFDPTTVDWETVELEEVSPVKAEILDSTQPGDYDPRDCYDCFNEQDWLNCDLSDDDINEDDAYCGDGIPDLVLYFDTQELVGALSARKGQCILLTLTGIAGDRAIVGGDSMVALKAIGH